MPGSIKKTPAVIMPERRFPPPWTVEDLGSCFVVKHSGRAANARCDLRHTLAFLRPLHDW